MRIRQVKPSFWTDARLAELPEGTRLFYIGLWMTADDAGWLAWDTAEIGRDLYGYEDRAVRERRLEAMRDELVAIGRLVVHPCGHVEIPTLAEHQRFAGTTRQVRTAFSEHQKRCNTTYPVLPAETRGDPRGSAGDAGEDAAPRVSPRSPADPRPGIGIGIGIGTERVEERNGTERNGSKPSRVRARDDDLLASYRKLGLPVDR